MLKDTLRWITLGGIFAVPIILPFIVSTSMFFPYITGKNFTFRIIVEIIFAAWLVLAFLDARYRPRFSWILSAVTFFVVVIGIADIFGANVFKSFWSNFERMEGYLAIVHLFGYFLVTSTVLNTEKLWTAFWYSSLVTSVIIAFVGLKPIIDMLPSISGIPRIDATFGNPIYLAVYALFHTFIALILMDRWHGSPWHRVLLGFVAVLHMAVMVLTQTRGTVLGFLGGAVVATIIIAIFERDRKALRVTAAVGLIGLVALIGTGFAIKDTEFAKTTPLIGRFTQIELSTGTVHARFMNWGMAWQGFKERPIFGWGQDNYEYVFSKYFDPGMYAEEPWFDRAHNIYFDWLVAAGIFGFVAYLLIFVSLFTQMWVIDPKERKYTFRSLVSFTTIRNLFKKRDHVFTATERALWTGLIVAYMFHNLFVFDNIISYILFFSVLAYLHWRTTEGQVPLWEKVEVTRETVITAILPIVIAGSAVTMWYVNYPGIKTAQALIDALMPQRQLANGQAVRQTPEDVLAYYDRALEYDQLGRQEVREQLAQMAANVRRSEGITPDTKLAFQQRSISELENEIARNPESARLLLFAGSLYGGYGQIDKAESAFRRAVELSPTKQTALFQLGEVLLVEKKNDEALDTFRRAFEAKPEYDEARKLYALALIRTGHDKEAVDLLTERFETPAVDDERLFIEWGNAKRYDIAVMILEERIAKDPENLQAKVSLAAAYKEMGQKDKALAVLEEIKQQHPEYADQMNQFIKDIRGW